MKKSKLKTIYIGQKKLKQKALIFNKIKKNF